MSTLEDEYIRRSAALKSVIDDHNDDNGRGGIAKVARRIGVEPSYLQRCLYEPGKEGRKRIGDKLIVKMNEHFPGWLQPGLLPLANTLSSLSTVESPVRLPVMNERERTIAEIVEILHKMSDKGLAVMLGRADEMARQYPITAQSKAS